MRILLIRNAETINNTESEKIESRDLDITTKGIEDSILLGNFMKENNFKINKCTTELIL